MQNCCPLTTAKSDSRIARPQALPPSDGSNPDYIEYMQCASEEWGPLGELGQFVGLSLRVHKLNIDIARVHNGKYTHSCCFYVGVGSYSFQR